MKREAAGHIESPVRKQGEMNECYSILEGQVYGMVPSSFRGSLPSSVKLLWKDPYRNTQKCISLVILNLVNVD